VGLEIMLNPIVGIGMSAAMGFRVSIPLLILAQGGWGDTVYLPDSLAWLGGAGVAEFLCMMAFVEVTGFFIPRAGFVLDLIATPIAVLLGVLLTWGCLSGVHPLARVPAALLFGGGAVITVQGLTCSARAMARATRRTSMVLALAVFEPLAAAIFASLILFNPILAITALALGLVGLKSRLNMLAERLTPSEQ
jgi:hypothetical protein